jgi:hypothetical protein
MSKRRILVELDSNTTVTSSVYLDVFGWVRDRETSMGVGRWQDVAEHANGRTA